MERIRSFLRRNTQTIPLVVIALCIGGILLLQAIQIGKFAESSKRDSEVILELKKIAEQRQKSDELTSQQIDRVDRHLDCIVIFFAQSDRSSKQIDQIDECRISNQDLSTVTTPQGNLPAQPSTQENTEQNQQGVSGRPSEPTTPSGNEMPEQSNVPIITPLVDAVLNVLGGNV